jgi:hypothetical protein
VARCAPPSRRPPGCAVNPWATALLAAACCVLAGLILLGPLLAVREDRRLAAEERGWLSQGCFPDRVERIYSSPRLLITDGPRLRELGYELVERRRARGPWGRVAVVVWRAAAPPAGGGRSAPLPAAGEQRPGSVG